LSALRRSALGLSCAWLLLGVVDPACATPATTAQELSLAVGENRTIPAGDVKNYSEGAPGIAEVKITPNGSQFVVVGQRPGSTTLLLIKKDGSEATLNINVFARAVQSVESELAELLRDTTGIRLKRVGARFFIEGGVSTEAEWKRIEHIAALYEGQVESLVVLGGAAADRKINIRVDLVFAQYDRTKLTQIGVAWPPSIGAGNVIESTFAYDFLAGGVAQAQAAIINQPFPALDLAARNGWAKVLKHATVITANGAEAKFSSGGAQNFPVAAGLTAAIEKIPFGTDLRVLPRFDPSSREIEVSVGAEISDLVPPVAATPLPGQNLSKLSTAVSLKLGQSIVLSGIRSKAERRGKAGLPWLSEIPILGMLFGSHSEESSEVEGAIFVIPSVVESISEPASELIDAAFAQYEDFDGDMDEVHTFQKHPTNKP
jgi:pilus assembly protein CpaC